jgi:uncharacterized protein (TIGR02266 family)
VSPFLREDTRYPVELAVKVGCPSWADYLDLYATNLSRGGLFIASGMSAPVGTELTVELSLPNGETVALHAEVAHLVKDEDGREPGMGVTFVDLDDETRRALEAMVMVARFTTRQAGNEPPPKIATRPAPRAAAAPPDPPRAARPPNAKIPSSRTPVLYDGLEQSLSDELAERRTRTPRQQLDVEPDADAMQIENGYRRLKERYQPAIFERYDAATQELVREINELVDRAWAALKPQRKP